MTIFLELSPPLTNYILLFYLSFFMVALLVRAVLFSSLEIKISNIIVLFLEIKLYLCIYAIKRKGHTKNPDCYCRYADNHIPSSDGFALHTASTELACP